MSRGGKREGAGRKAGEPNKATQKKRDAIEASGLTPLDYMLSILRDETQSQGDRMDAAKASAPFVHARLAAIEHSGGMTLSHEEALRKLDEPDGKANPDATEG